MHDNTLLWFVLRSKLLSAPPLHYHFRSGCVDLTFGDGGCATVYSYSHSRGLYAGLSLEGSVIFPRPTVNHQFYGRAVTPKELLTGAVPPPRAAGPLYDALHEAFGALSQPTYARIPLTLSMGIGNSSRSSSYASNHSSSAKQIAPFGADIGRRSPLTLDRESSNSLDSSTGPNTSVKNSKTAKNFFAIDGKPRYSTRIL
jgi:Las17-binding protein actin regulator